MLRREFEATRQDSDCWIRVALVRGRAAERKTWRAKVEEPNQVLPANAVKSWRPGVPPSN